MRIIVLGTIDFTRHCLEQILQQGGQVVAVLTLDRKDAGFHSDYADLSPAADRYGVPVYKIKKINANSTIELVKSLKPDVMFVLGWSQLVSRAIRDIPSKGCIGSHPALLPKDRGRHPLIWALVRGYRQSGLTFFYLDEGADNGDILWQKPFAISPNDDAATLYEKIMLLASEAIQEFLPQLESGAAQRIVQDHSQATYLRKRNENDGEIDWSQSVEDVHNLIRGLARPYVGAHTYLGGAKMIIWRSSLPDSSAGGGYVHPGPGMVFTGHDGALCVSTSTEYIQLQEYESAVGTSLAPGDLLGPRP